MDQSSIASRRKHPRHTLQNTVTVVDKNSNKTLGTIANLSQEGIMLVNNQPLEAENIYQIRLCIAEGLTNDQQPVSIEMGIDCLWVSPIGANASTYWSGCQIIDISDSDSALIEKIIQSLGQ